MSHGGWLGLAAFSLAAGCASAPGTQGADPPLPAALAAVPLHNPGFENVPRPGERCPERWECSAHVDMTSFRVAVHEMQAAEGRRGMCIERVGKEPWALVTQAMNAPTLRGKRLRFSMAVRVERAEGAGGGPWVIVHGTQRNDAHEKRLVASTRGWQRYAVEVPVTASARMVEVGATLEGGGRVCFDDARLEVVAQ